MSAAEEHRTLATLLDATAAMTPDLLVEVAAHHRADVWTGRRADQFGDALDDRRRELRVAADELQRQATELRKRAELCDLLIGPVP